MCSVEPAGLNLWKIRSNRTPVIYGHKKHNSGGIFINSFRLGVQHQHQQCSPLIRLSIGEDTNKMAFSKPEPYIIHTYIHGRHDHCLIRIKPDSRFSGQCGMFMHQVRCDQSSNFDQLKG